MSESTLEAGAVVRRYHHAWSNHRYSEAVALLADELQVEVPVNHYPTRAAFGAALSSFGDLVDPRVTPPTESRGKFGANGFKVNGKIFAMWVSESLVVKLPKSEVQLAVSQGRGRALKMGAGRVMEEWLVVDEPEERWPAIAEKALAFVSGDA